MLPALGIPKTEVARRLGISRAMLYALISERAPVSPAMALRLGRLLGTSAESWLDMQRDYDLRTLEPAMSEALAEIKPVAAREEAAERPEARPLGHARVNAPAPRA